MNKKLLTAVIGAALAAPLSVSADYGNFNISGMLRVGVESYKLSGGAGPYNNELMVTDNLSRIILAGAGDDMGNGTKGFFQVEIRFSPDMGASGSATGLAAGNTGAGLQGAFGKLTLGRWDLHYTETMVDFSRAGSLPSVLSVGPFNQVNGTAIATVGTRSNNAIVWDSPNWAGFTARLGYSTNPLGDEGSGKGADGSDGAATNVALRYTAGGFTVGTSMWDLESEGAPADTGDQKSLKAHAGYTFPFGLKVTVAYDKSEVRIGNGADMTERTALMLPIRYVMGSHHFNFNYVKMDELSGPNGGATTANTDAKAMMVGWDVALDKRTTVGLTYTKLTNEANAAYNLYGPHLGTAATLSGSQATAGEDVTQIFAGLSHSF